MRATPLMLGAALLALTPSAALAQRRPPPASSSGDLSANARAKGEEGLRLFNAGQWAEAYEQFQKADELFHAPTLVLFMGNCQKARGKLIEARALYQKVAAEKLPNVAPEAFVKARASARTALDDLKRRIPSLQVTLTGPGAATARAQVTLDGVTMSASEMTGQEINPGDHKLTASADGLETTTRNVTVPEGSTLTVDLPLGSPLPPVGPPPDSSAERGSLAPAVVAFGLGVAGLGVGAVTGLVSMGEVNDIKSRCNAASQCLVSDLPEANRAANLATVSTIGFIGGGALVGAGVVLLVVRPGGKGSEAAQVGAMIGPRSIRLAGVF
jgi:hypothetical protein